MKIRIKGNSVRFRLTKTEVATLCNTGSIQEKTVFGANKFIYKVKLDAQAQQLTANFSNNTITMVLPANITQNWENNDRVGFEHEQPLNHGEKLYLLIEKDFTCLDNTMEDQSDNYPNPKLQESNS
ncbi:MAG: hypothetical protein HKP24_09615 [Croceitalea sp.]|nr:hypothetical protein [Croceitalea sp.]NNM18808.1 hypothetical protein [Croceitalea sp.]